MYPCKSDSRIAKREEPPQIEHARSKARALAEKAGYLLTGNYAACAPLAG